MNSSFPACVVLLATHNGESWIREQMNSIQLQQGVELRVVVSDDLSVDGTVSVIHEYDCTLNISVLQGQLSGFGSANRNFLRLIRDANIGEAEYVALADQDDIWSPNKLRHAINRLNESNAHGYSSDVEAFWPDGRSRIIKKSYKQKEFDYLFGSPGPGCTFVFTRSLFLEMRAWVTANFSVLSQLWVHDWILYAYARARGYRWIIDDVHTMRYRQHKSNEIGANFGFQAIRRRIAVVKNGRYRHDVLVIAELTGANPECAQALRRLSWIDRLWLIRHANQFRRSLPEVLALRLFFVLMPSTRIPLVP
jgi:rhamnosyltransferase